MSNAELAMLLGKASGTILKLLSISGGLILPATHHSAHDVATELLSAAYKLHDAEKQAREVTK